MISISVIIYVTFTVMLGVVTYMAKRYIVRQDAKMDLLFDKFEKITNTFIEAVDELKHSINDITVNVVTHRALCDERNAHVHEKIVFIEKGVQDLYNKVNALWAGDKDTKPLK